MKLPEIETNAPVQTSSEGFGLIDAAQRQAAGAVEQGFQAFGQEMIKSQNSKAAAELLSGLEHAQIDLRSKKTISTQDLKDTLGSDYDSLDPRIKAQTTRSVLNPQTGQMETQERDDIPMFSVAESIYDARAKKLLEDSASHFTGDRAAQEFRDKAQHEILTQRQKLSMKTMYDMHDYLRTQDTATAIDLANAGRPDDAKKVLAGSNTMDLAHKEQVSNHIDKVTQTRPLYEALRTHDIGTMAQQLTQLGDPKQFTKLSPEERDQFTNRLTAEIKDFQRQVSSADDEVLKRNAEAGWNGILSKVRDGQPVSYSDVPMPGAVKADAQREMIAYVDKINKGEKPDTDMGLYAGLTQLATSDRQKFTTTDLLKYRNRLSDADFKHFVDLQAGLRGGNPEAYDHFQTTDEAIDTQLRAPQYNIDPKDKNNAEKVGYVKTLVQHELAAAQERNGGKPLSLEERDGVISATLKNSIDPRKEGYVFGLIGGHNSTILGAKAGVDPAAAATFQKAVSALDPSFSSLDGDKKVKKLTDQYGDYQMLEPYIDHAWKIQKGKNITPSDSVQMWYYARKNWSRLEGQLQTQGQLEQSASENAKKIVNMALREVLRGSGK